MSTRASRTDVLRLRLERHGLSGTAGGPAGLGGPIAVVERMLAIQAQDLPAAGWALGVRSPGTVAADVAAALNEGSIVRSYPMRGTVHLVPARDVRWILDLTARRVVSSMTTRRRQLGLTETIIGSAAEAAVGLLSGGRQLTRAPFLAGLRSAGIPTDGQRGYHLIVALALEGLVVWGPSQGTLPALALLDEWAPVQRRLDRSEGLAEFLTRYLDGHGPASLRDFAAWCQLTVEDSRTARREAGARVEELEVDGEALLFPASAERGTLGSRPVQHSPVLALPGFDEYLLGYRDRSFVIADKDFPRVVPGLNGIFLPLIVAGGRVIGTWRKETTRARTTGASGTGRTPEPVVTVQPSPFAPLSTRRSTGFARAIRDYARFTGLPTTTTAPAAAPDGVVAIS